MAVTRYDVKNVKLFFNGIEVDSGFGSDNAITIARNEDHVNATVGTHGDIIVATNNNNTGELRVNMQAVSTWANIFREAVRVFKASDSISKFLYVGIYDEATNTKLLSYAWPKSQPDVGLGASPTDEEFVFGLENSGFSVIDAVENVSDIFTEIPA